MHLPTFASRSLALVALCSLGVFGCDPTSEPVGDAHDITVRGSATASLNGLSFSMAAPVYVETY